MILFENVRKEYRSDNGPILALKNFDLTVNNGETVCLMGTSGSGKTTALKMVNRLIEPTSGRITIDGKDVIKRDKTALRRSIGYVIQRGGLFPHMNVSRNIGLLCRLEGWKPEKIEERTNELLELVNLPPAKFAARKPSELSGGQQQRVSVARALSLDPDILLMDEPFGALDPITRNELHDEFISLREKVGKTVLLVTHDLEEAFKLGERIALLDHGELIQFGKAEDFTERPANQFVKDFVGFSGKGGDR